MSMSAGRRMMGDSPRDAARRQACAQVRIRGAFALGGIWFGIAIPTGSAWGATGWPSRPIRLIVPFPPAASTDILAREIVLKLQEELGQPQRTSRQSAERRRPSSSA
jgi:hypothetical protein